MSEIRVGISGWRYAPWRGSFYPKRLIQKKELYYASRTVNTIEINGSFYALQTPERYATWYDEVPTDFKFSVKGPRFITHIQRLRDVEVPVANFFASGVLELGDKLGPILWQFPPSFQFNKQQFRHFLTLLPKDTNAARACAENCAPEIRQPGIKPVTNTGLRYSVEIRNESFRNPEFVELLREFNLALVVADTAGRWPQMEDITSDFVYLRLHGDAELYKSGYSAEALERWFERITLWSQGKQPEDAKLTLASDPTAKEKDPEKEKEKEKQKNQSRDIYCYFDNTDKLWAPYDARKMLEKFHLADTLEETPGKLSAAMAKALAKPKKP